MEAAGRAVAAAGRAGGAAGVGAAGPAVRRAPHPLSAQSLCAGPGAVLAAQSPGAVAAEKAVCLPRGHHHGAAHPGLWRGGRRAVGPVLDGSGAGAGPVSQLGDGGGRHGVQPGPGAGVAGRPERADSRQRIHRRRAAGPAAGELGAGHRRVRLAENGGGPGALPGGPGLRLCGGHHRVFDGHLLHHR